MKPQQIGMDGFVTDARAAFAVAVLERKQRKRGASKEDLFDFQCRTMKLPPFTRQAMFAKQAMNRQWRADFCWEAYRLLVEIDGLVPYHVGKGRHQTIGGQEEDMRKGNAAIELGYTVLHFSQGMTKSGEAIETTMRVLAARGWQREEQTP